MDSLAKVDLHMHTTVSDGSDKPEDIIARVKDAGIKIFSVTDHDAVKGCRIIRGALRSDDPTFICGAEFSCKDEDGKYHILAYYDDPNSAAINGLVEKGHALRMEKVALRLEFLRTEFGFEFPKDETDKLLSLDNPGKPHIGNLMIKSGYAPDIKTAIRDYIDKLHIKSKYIRPEDAIKSIIKGGGIPVLAHPFFGDGDQLILGEEMEKRLTKLIGYGLKGVEAFYSGFSPKLIKTMIGYAEKYKLFVTAGSDYHGTNKLVRLGETGLEYAEELPSGFTAFFKAFGIEL